MAEEECGVFRGVVFSGRGEGSFYVSIYAKEFRRTLGFTPYPGTLNVRLYREDALRFNQCLSIVPKKIIEPPRIEGMKLARVIAFPLVVNGVRAWGIRPEITVYKNDVVEIISERYLRRELEVDDGSEVYISLSVLQEES